MTRHQLPIKHLKLNGDLANKLVEGHLKKITSKLGYLHYLLNKGPEKSNESSCIEISKIYMPHPQSLQEC